MPTPPAFRLAVARGALTLALVACTWAPAYAQLVVFDPVTTSRNAVTAWIKTDIVEKLTQQRDRLDRMARRLSVYTDLRKYVLPDTPLWRIHDFETRLFANDYHAALNYGDPTGLGYARVTRARVAPTPLPSDPAARRAVEAALATLDVADSMAIAGTDQTGLLRYNGRRELAAIQALETDVVDPSDAHSATAVLDKISGAVLIEARQKQARLQFLTAIVEQLVLENKRARDSEAALMNMQLGRLRGGRPAATALVDRAADDLRTWRQP